MFKLIIKSGAAYILSQNIFFEKNNQEYIYFYLKNDTISKIKKEHIEKIEYI